MKKKLDAFEKDILESYEKGDLRSTSPSKTEFEKYRSAARETFVMGSTELAAKLFRATQAEEKLRRDEVKGKTAANRTHREVGAKVRQTIRELGGTMPEELPVLESIKKIETKQRKRLGKTETPAKKKSDDK